MKQIIEDLTQFLNDNLGTTDPHVTFDSFGDSSLNIQVLYLIEDTEFSSYLKVKEEINFKIIEIVQKYGSDFAYPTQRTVGDKSIKGN
jgi:MscS family membrane protein